MTFFLFLVNVLAGLFVSAFAWIVVWAQYDYMFNRDKLYS
jgi:hypothetical protein